MALQGRLATVSLGEVFQILDRSRRTGRLTLQIAADELQRELSYQVWFSQGRIVAVGTQSHPAELLMMLRRRRWVSPELVLELNDLQRLDTPLGVYLKNQGVLQPEQLKLLFHAQVIQRVCGLFKFQDGKFRFDASVAAPKAEMTGLSISTSEAILLGLRSLRDWTLLESRLPNPRSLLGKSVMARVTVQLDALEKRVWEHATGMLTLRAIAQQLIQPIELVQQAAFRLRMVGLVEELPADSTLPKLEDCQELPNQMVPVMEPTQPQVSQSFLQNLLGFLRSKV